ncbi:phosphoenolpyruvate--protein phosphotransferase [Phytobacter sp. AG2a]
MSVAFTWKCTLQEGVHARPAGYIERLCHLFTADVQWCNTRTLLTANAKSALALIATDTLQGDVCNIVLVGDDEHTASVQLHFLLNQLEVWKEGQEESSALAEGYLPRSLQETQAEFIAGTRVSGGVAIARPVIFHNLTLAEILARNPGGPFSPEDEKARISKGLQRIRRQKEALLNTSRSLEHDILQAHISLVTDPQFLDTLMGYINANENAWSAVVQAAMATCETLSESTSRYINERTLDVFDIALQLLTHMYGAEAVSQPPLILHRPSVVFANSLTPSQFLALNKQWLAGIVLSSGGKTSHTAILTRASGIPALADIDFHDFTLRPEQDIVLDGDLGGIIATPTEQVLHYYRNERQVRHDMQQRMLANVQAPAVTADGHPVEIAANITRPEEATLAFENGALSIGLFRTEMSFMERTSSPDYHELLALYSQVMNAARGKTVIFRTFDIGGDKPIAWLAREKEENPFLGFRAVRTYPTLHGLFMQQLKAILAASAVGAAKVMIPMVAHVEEIIWCRAQLEQAKAQLREEGVAFDSSIELGVMLEVPSVLFSIPDMAAYADFFSIGSNDLTQYFFAADRGNTQVRDIYDNHAPAFLRALQFAVEEVHRAGKWIGLCGEMAASGAFLPVLVGMGFDELSINGPSIPVIKQALRELDYHKCRTLAGALMQAQRSATVKERLLSPDVYAVSPKPVLAPELVLWELDARDKNDAIKRMVDNLWLHQRTDNRHQLCDDVWRREAPFPTVAGQGIAIPHARSRHASDSSISVATLARPVFWGGQEVDTIFMLTISESAPDAEHMRYFSTLARMLMNDDFIKKTKNSTDPQALYRLLSRTLTF